jgi:hypothetical protein
MFLTPMRLLLLASGGIVLLVSYLAAKRRLATTSATGHIYSKYWAYVFLVLAAVTLVSILAHLIPSKFVFVLGGAATALTLAAARDLRARRALEHRTPN